MKRKITTAAAAFTLLVALLLSACSAAPLTASDIVGKYGTSDVVSDYSSFLPTIEFLQDGKFLFTVTSTTYVMGTYTFSGEAKAITLAVTENTTSQSNDFYAGLTFAVKTKDELTLDKGIPDTVKDAAIFTRIAVQEQEVK